MELSYRQYTELMDELVSEGYNVLEASQMIFSGQLTEEQVWEGVEEWVNSLLEEGYDLSDYTWEEMYEEYLTEMGFNPAAGKPAKPETINLKPQKGVTAGGNVTLGRGYEATLGGKKGQLSYVRGSQGRLQRTFRQLGSEANPPSAAQAKQDQADPRRNSASTPRPAVTPAATSPRLAATRPATGIARGSGPSTPAKPATPTSPAKPATPTSPATPTAPTKPATTPMQQFAAANPKLAAASAERDRTRGTSATTNPLMKKTFGADYVSKMPAPKTPSPTTSSTAFSSSPPALGSSTPAMQSAGTAAASKPTTTGVSGFKMSTDLSKPAETKKNQQKIAAGMEIKGNSLQEELRGDSYGSNARPDSLYDAYQSIYNQ